jgi:hypothetical protein
MLPLLMSLIARRQRHEQGHISRQDGQTLIEFALVLPLLLIVVLGVIDLGRALGYKNDMTNLANQGARAAAVNNCPGGCTASVPNISSWIISQAPSDELKNGTGAISPNGLSSPSAITFAFPGTGATNHCIGDPVKVTIKVHYNWMNFLTLGGALPSIGADITSSATMRLEKSYKGDGSDKYSATTSLVGTCTS